MGRFDPAEADKAQERYCIEHEIPRFAPRGPCWSCGENIFLPLYGRGREATGISVEAAGAHLITLCPHCKRSYLD